MKKFLSIILAILMIVITIPIAFAADVVASGECGTNVTWTLDSAGVLTISGEGVVESGPWTSYKDDIEEVVFIDVVKIYSYSPFSGCSNLQKVIFYGNATFASVYAFEDCSNLQEVIFYGDATFNSAYTFDGCSNLQKAIFYGDATFNSATFDGCSNLTEVIFYGDATFDSSTFHGCSKLTELSFGGEVKVDSYFAFFDSDDFHAVNVHFCGTQEKWEAITRQIKHSGCPVKNATPHYCEKIEKVDVTCSTDGYTVGIYCSDCEGYIAGHDIIPALNHKGTLVHVGRLSPYCTDIGWEAYEYCTACDYTTYVEIPPLGHRFEGSDICSVCGERSYRYDEETNTYMVYAYEGLEVALKAGGEIILMKDIIKANPDVLTTVPENVTAVLDLNGKTISVAPGADPNLLCPIFEVLGDLTVTYDGTIGGTDCEVGVFFVDGGNLTIESGNFITNSTFTSAIHVYRGNAVIYDGSVTGGVYVFNGEVVIYGGTFSEDPSEFVANGYGAVANEDGTWTVDCLHTDKIQVKALAPTCKESGWDAYEMCKVCGHNNLVLIPALNHKDTLVKVDAKAPTCTEIGWEAYEYCTACDYTTKVEKEALNHKDTLVQVDAKAPTCTEIGWDAYEYCTACTYTTYVEKEALNHKDTLVKVDAKAPTCTEIGWDAYEYCTACDYTTYVETPVDTDAHDWSNCDGSCVICNIECDHETYTNEVCDICGWICDHTTVNVSESKCDYCGRDIDSAEITVGETVSVNDITVYEFTPEYSGTYIVSSSIAEGYSDPCAELYKGDVYIDGYDDCYDENGEIIDYDFNFTYNYEAGQKYYLVVSDLSAIYGFTVDVECETHNWSEGKCLACGTVCDHAEQTGAACEICGSALHVCDFSGEWKYDSEKHWKECTCGETDKEAVHTLTEGKCECGYECPHEWVGVAFVKPTRTEEGYYTYTCSVCKSTKTEPVERASNYAEFKELLEKVKGYLDENLTDSMMQEVKNVINFFELDENHGFIKGEENTVSQMIRQISGFIEVVEEGIADGTALKADYTYIDEVIAEIEEKFADEYLTDEKKAELEEIKSDIEKLKADPDTSVADLEGLERSVYNIFTAAENCFNGYHGGPRYELTEEAQCGKNAVESATCSFCGKVLTREVENSALTHSFTKYEVTEEAKCGVAGKKVAVCDNGCGETDEKAIEALEHSLVLIKTTPAGCGVPMVEFYNCEFCCNCEVARPKFGTELFHSFTKYEVTEEAKCGVEGKKVAACDNGCGETDEKVIEALKHDIVIDEAVAPKCGESGLTQGEHCTRCDYKVEQEVVPALKHSFTKYEVTEEAKCGIEGKEVAYCDNGCGATDEKVIEALTHSFTKYEETEAPKCDVEGKKVAYCDNGCGETDEKAIEALTHADADGDYKCDNGCGHEFEKPAPEEPTPDTPDESTDNCDHLCHKGGFMGFIWKIVKFFSKLFKINPVCECGAAHY